MHNHGTTALDRPVSPDGGALVTSLDTRWMGVLDLAIALYASDMPDVPGSVSDGRLIGWGEQGLGRVGPARVSMASARLLDGAASVGPDDLDGTNAVYGVMVPGWTGVEPSEARRRSALRAAWALLAALDGQGVAGGAR